MGPIMEQAILANTSVNARRRLERVATVADLQDVVLIL
jgi:hypothetical protein